jgi:hypothetical protein
MTEQEKIDFLLKILNNQKFELTLKEANDLLVAYKWLYEMKQKSAESK